MHFNGFDFIILFAGILVGLFFGYLAAKES